MKHVSTYKLTNMIKTMLEKQGYILTCRRCGRPLRTGDTVKSKRSNWMSREPSCRRAFFHEQCWNGMFME